MEADFTFVLPCIVIDFFLNNQPDAPIIQIYSLLKLYMFRAFSLPIIRRSMYSRELLMTGREDARNMQSFITE